MLLSAVLTWLARAEHAGRTVLLVAVLAAGLTIVVRPIAQILRGNFSVDLLVVLSIVTSLVLGQYWVAAIVILMLSGGEALEEPRLSPCLLRACRACPAHAADRPPRSP
jgi:cation transport ATPase